MDGHEAANAKPGYGCITKKTSFAYNHQNYRLLRCFTFVALGRSRWRSLRCSRGSYLGEDDIERIEDIYGRSTPVERRVAVKTIAQ